MNFAAVDTARAGSTVEFNMPAPDCAWLETAESERLPLRASCAIGRSPENHVVVAGEKISRRHALIHCQNETEFWLVDLGSRNGTFRNGVRIKQPTALRNGDTIGVGPTEFRFCLDESAGTSQRNDTSAAMAETMVSRRASWVWLLLVDVENFTALAQTLDADELAQKLGAWLLHCADLVEQSGGCVDKYLGDGLLAYWDRQRAKPEAFAATLTQFTDLQKTSELPFRWTLHYAPMQLGISRFGNDSLVGSEINFAHRMEKVAAGLGLHQLLSQFAADSVAPWLPTQSVGNHPVKGFNGTFEFFRL